jgi:hypothetical protein
MDLARDVDKSQGTMMEPIGDEGGPPGFVCAQGELKIEDWLEARALRRELDAAIKR